LARDRHRSQTPGRRDRHPAYLGTEPAPASPHSLRHSRRRTLARSPSLDPPTLSFLLTRQGPQPRLSWRTASAANASGFLLVSSSKTPRIEIPLAPKVCPRRFRSRLATIRKFGCDDHKRPSRGTITTFISTR